MLGWTPISSAKTIKQIAAIALLHDLTMVMHNINKFADCGMRLPNPFQGR